MPQAIQRVAIGVVEDELKLWLVPLGGIVYPSVSSDLRLVGLDLQVPVDALPLS